MFWRVVNTRYAGAGTAQAGAVVHYVIVITSRRHLSL
jgi:hypothetical protein